jgi:DNA-binding transcriptional ArsR family regulator
MATDAPADLAGRTLTALADPTRRAVVQSLGDAGPQRAGALAGRLGTSAPTMSRHLRVLLDAGVVVDDRPADDARARVFRLRPESVHAVRAWLDQLQAHWDEQLASYRLHVEGRDAESPSTAARGTSTATRSTR